MKKKSLENKTCAIHNLGCKVNYYESEKIKNEMQMAGAKLVDFSEKADIYIINTCSVTAIADKKSRQMIHRAKKINPSAVVVACGCFVQKEMNPKDLDCDIIIGNDEKKDLSDKLDRYFEDSANRIYRHDINFKQEEFEDLFINDSEDEFLNEDNYFKEHSHTRAFVKIQDGCNEFCTYCIIPYVRGRIRSRSVSSVIDEIINISKSGIKEVVLTGIHLSSYESKNDNNIFGLLELCETIDLKTEIKRLRLGSLEPRIVTEDFAKRLSKLDCMCPHFHLSLQSGCDATIKRMNRKYTTDDFREAVRLLRKYFDNPAITTDVITGFPGEDEKEFEQSYNFVKEIGFADLHVFPFSEREGTPAVKMPDKVTKAVKHERSERLIELGKQMTAEYMEYWNDKEVEVLFEESDIMDGRLVWSGYSREYVKYHYTSDEELKNVIKSVRRSINA